MCLLGFHLPWFQNCLVVVVLGSVKDFTEYITQFEYTFVKRSLVAVD